MIPFQSLKALVAQARQTPEAVHTAEIGNATVHLCLEDDELKMLVETEFKPHERICVPACDVVDCLQRTPIEVLGEFIAWCLEPDPYQVLTPQAMNLPASI